MGPWEVHRIRWGPGSEVSALIRRDTDSPLSFSWSALPPKGHVSTVGKPTGELTPETALSSDFQPPEP